MEFYQNQYLHCDSKKISFCNIIIVSQITNQNSIVERGGRLPFFYIMPFLIKHASRAIIVLILAYMNTAQSHNKNKKRKLSIFLSLRHEKKTHFTKIQIPNSPFRHF